MIGPFHGESENTHKNLLFEKHKMGINPYWNSPLKPLLKKIPGGYRDPIKRYAKRKICRHNNVGNNQKSISSEYGNNPHKLT